MKNRAFTLIELLVVISIIALLSSVVSASLNSSRAKGTLAAGQLQSSSLTHALADAGVLKLVFNECFGSDAGDSSGLGNNGVISGLPTWVSSYSSPGCALSFDGSTKFVTVSSLSNLQSPDVTFSAWINPTTNQGEIITKELQYKYRVSNGALQALVSCNGGSWSAIVTGGTISINKWQFVVLVVDSVNQKVSLYINGALATSSALGCSITGFNAESVRIGTYGPGGFFSGSIDEAHIYTRTLTSLEIQQTYLAEAAALGITLVDSR